MSEPAVWCVAAFYRFVRLSEGELQAIRDQVHACLSEASVLGLILIAPEGVNGTIAGTREGVRSVASWLCERFELGDFDFKVSESEVKPFQRLTVDVREEIVALRRPDLMPRERSHRHLDPQAWHELITGSQDYTLIDTRNDYEVALGRFPGAINPVTTSFREWPDWVKSTDLPKDKPILIYCTGGIRCEKAILQLEESGYENVFQLRNGILGYLEAFPEGAYEGECYVFDDRVAVDAHLKPSKITGNCPGCGHPSRESAQCGWCGGPAFLCSVCEPRWPKACSKECKDRIQRHGPRNPDPI